MDETEQVITTLRERARRHGLSLEQELSAILAAAEASQAGTALPPIRLTTVRGTATSSWSREEIYGDEGR
jgi:plasmid stability protein